MKITFENGAGKMSVDQTAASYSSSFDGRIKETGRKSYALDISGIVTDNNAYGIHGRTAEDVMQSAAQTDVTAQKNYMAVMSNSMSEEDFARMMEDGFHPGSMELETVVTILDRIKAAMLKGGATITGYTDDMDPDTLEKITGSETFANELLEQFHKHDIPVTRQNVDAVMQTWEKAARLKQPDDGETKYLIQNQMEPTVDNLYTSQFSGASRDNRQSKGYYAEELSGYYARKAEDYNWEQLESQMIEVAQKAGLPADGETLQNSRWLVENGIPLTPGALLSLNTLHELEYPLTEQKILSAAAAAISDGKAPGGANPADARSDREKAAELAAEVSAISDEAADRTIDAGEPLTVRNLLKFQRRPEAGGPGRRQTEASTGGTPETDTEKITARRQLEEVRLLMTAEANLKLLRSGYAIDTAPIEQLIADLKAAESEQTAALFGGEVRPAGPADPQAAGSEGASSYPQAETKAALYKETQAKTAEIPRLPAAVIGEIAGPGVTFTLDTIYHKGMARAEAYRRAGESYEALMTEPRKDLGDSIRKAFRNVDDILEELDLALTEDNRKAVRILGYNQMEVTGEQIEKVRTAYQKVRQTVDEMTPAAVLDMIREGENPLSMNMDELRQYFDERRQEPQEQTEKYAKFLYKLEQNHSIAHEEREAYIGVYRLLRQLDKTDGAAIGTLLSEGAELSLKNLLSAMRSNKKQGELDVSVDDSFGGVTARWPDTQENPSISAQIESGFAYYRGLTGEIYRELEPEKLASVNLSENPGLEELAQALADTGKDPKSEEAYRREQLKQTKTAVEEEDAAVKLLTDFELPVTADHLTAAGLLQGQRGEWYRKTMEYAGRTGGTAGSRQKLERASGQLFERLTDADSAKEAYGELGQALSETLEEAADRSESSLDVRAIQLLQKQLSLAGGLAQRESYEVPVTINGELTSINLTIIRGGGKNASVCIRMETEELGRAEAYFTQDAGEPGEINGYIACTDSGRLERFTGIRDEMNRRLYEAGYNRSEITAVCGKSLDSEIPSSHGKEMEESTRASGRRLYGIAKLFIGLVREPITA